MNIRLDIEYDGLDFHGWQRQPQSPTIQAEVEDCLSKVLERKSLFTVRAEPIAGSMRKVRWQISTWIMIKSLLCRWAAVLNFMLPRTIRIRSSALASDDFHAQKDAVSKIYEYRILNRAHASALDRRVHLYPRDLDWDAIRAALPEFVGEKDFRAFQGAKADVRSTVRRIIRFELHQEYDGLYKFQIEGNGFLKQMVRTIIGTLLEVGEGKREPSDIGAILASLNRDRAGRTVAPHGLCLMHVEYNRDTRTGCLAGT